MRARTATGNGLEVCVREPMTLTDPSLPEVILPRAVLVDDDPVILAALGAQLRHEFSVVGVAEDADHAIKLACQVHPDLALVDVEMPGGGLLATRGIRKGSPDTAIVILTADESRSSVLQFLDAGAIAYLRKGLPAYQLAPRLNEAISAHRTLGTHVDRRRQAAEDRFHAAFDQAAIGMAIVALEGSQAGLLVEANEAYATLIGREVSELAGANVEQWTHPDDLPDGVTDPLAVLARGDRQRVEFEQRYLHQDGRVISAIGTAAAFTDENARHVAIIQMLDISERKQFEGELAYLADHDTLTGLFNRRRFAEELDRELVRTRRYGGNGAVLVLDFDGFKFVNDSLGHAAGDELVSALGATIRRTLRESDIAARTGGDEFAIVLPETDLEAAMLVSEKLLSAIRRNGTIVHGEQDARVTTSIGVTMFDADDQLTAADLIVEGDIAMYDAKEAGKDRACLYHRDTQRRERPTVRPDWARRLQDALDLNRFVLHAQPIVPVCSNGVPRFELLLRMQDDQGDLIAPGAFLYNAERFDLIQPIDYWVMSEAVSMLHDYHARGQDLSLAINVSGKTLNTGAIGEHLKTLMQTHRFPEGRLVVELTETVAITSIERARELARDLRDLGCRLALDDFGTGFATFYYLKHLDFDYIKIDGEFVQRLPDTPADQLVVQAVVDIARGLGIDTIAEFVQNDETLSFLRDFGVGYAQGYHTGRPGALDLVLAQFAPAWSHRTRSDD
jgi:diguanylate cyclase (GGDEF)-like protein/PAS domain S-box-containing protein